MELTMPPYVAVLILAIGCIFSSSEALKCMSCNGSPKYCEKNSEIIDCPEYAGADFVCRSFYDWSNNGANVQKGCYQRTACKVQANETDNDCSDFAGKDRPCRCCCSKNRCNRLGKGCVTESQCPVLTSPKIGNITCTNRSRGGVCELTCPPNYETVGEKMICKQGTNKLFWTKRQTCEDITCRKLSSPENGKMTCTNAARYKDRVEANYPGAICNFSCNEGYKLQGNNKTSCRKEKGWTNEVPECVLDPCKEITQRPNRIDECTNGNKQGSICRFECVKGYKLKGSKTTRCVTRGRKPLWDNPAPYCVQITCPLLHGLTHGSVSCTNANFENSVCTFECYDGYDISGTVASTTSTTCKDDENGDEFGIWTTPPPTCSRIRCEPEHSNPQYGKVTCSDANNEGSVCYFSCNKGYDLDGTIQEIEESRCQDDDDGDSFGKWSNPAPTCSPIACEVLVGPANGSMRCTAESALGSECEFQCDYGFSLVGARRVTCEDIQGDRDNVGEWSEDIPKCEPIYCSPQTHDAIVEKVCDSDGTDMFRVGTQCTYTCAEEGYYLVDQERPYEVVTSGFVVSTCLNTSVWDRLVPTCSPVTCPKIIPPENSESGSCTDDNNLGSICRFNCTPTYALSHVEPLICESDGTDFDKIGKWSQTPPTCDKSECDPFPTVNNGVIKYTKGLNIGSIAKLECDVGYTYKLHELSECRPKNDGNNEPYWNKVNNVCCVKCIFNSRLLLVVVIDKTAAQNQEEWDKIVSWNYYILESLYKNYDVEFGMVVYDNTIDEARTVKDLKRLEELENVEDVTYEMFNFAYGGSDSNTTAALEYARSNYFKKYSATTTSRRPSREPFVIVIKRPGYPGHAIESARKLLDDRINVMALGFKEGDFMTEKNNLALITSDPDRVTMVGGVTDFYVVGEVLTEITKKYGCSPSSRSNPCT